MSVVKQAKAELEAAYKECGVMVIKDALDIIAKYQDAAEEEAPPDFNIDDLQADALRLTALNFTIHSYMVQFETKASKAKAKVKFERARQFNLLKQADIKKSDGRCENEAEEGVYQFVLEEIEAWRGVKYLDIAWNRIVDMVNMLKKFVERMMWQGPQGA